MFGKKADDYDLEYFVLHDSKAKNYREPMLAMNEHDMVRQIENLFTDPAQARNPLYLNAEDFSIFRAGTFSKKTGRVTGCELEHVANLHDIRAMVERRKAPVGMSAT